MTLCFNTIMIWWCLSKSHNVKYEKVFWWINQMIQSVSQPMKKNIGKHLILSKFLFHKCKSLNKVYRVFRNEYKIGNIVDFDIQHIFQQQTSDSIWWLLVQGYNAHPTELTWKSQTLWSLKSYILYCESSKFESKVLHEWKAV